MVTATSLVAIPVDDIEEALHFFCELLGMEKRRDLLASHRNVYGLTDTTAFQRSRRYRATVGPLARREGRGAPGSGFPSLLRGPLWR